MLMWFRVFKRMQFRVYEVQGRFRICFGWCRMCLG